MSFIRSSFLIFTILFAIKVKARPYFLSTGTFVPFVGKAQISNSGGSEKFAYNPYLSIGTPIQMSGRHFFVPEIGFNFFLENAKRTTRSNIFLKYDFASKISPNLALRYGITNNWYRLSGQGGSNTLRNGNGYTDFPAPNKTVTSYYTTIDLGIDYRFKSAMSARFDINIMSINRFENKAYNYLFTINFLR